MPEPPRARKCLIRSCDYCRSRKVRCDGQKPSCKPCIDHQRGCVYQKTLPGPRPTKAEMNGLHAENRRFLALLQRLKSEKNPQDLWSALHSSEDQVQSQNHAALGPPTLTHSAPCNEESTNIRQDNAEFVQLAPGQPAFNTSPYPSVDESGNFNSFGPSSAWKVITDAPHTQTAATASTQNALVANAALSRQLEHRLATLGELDGVPIDLAIHLLDLHWNRQHHTFLLTYRPAIIRDLLNGGQFGSKFLLNSIFACASKFSTRAEISSQSTASGFFRRCDEIMSQENLLFYPSLPTIVGLLLLGSTNVAQGEATKGWLLTGYALRMVYDLGLHIDRKATVDDVIEEEIRKRIFWGAFICDKLQSLYLGRPFAIKLRDAHVSLELNDIMEENEPWVPYDGSTNIGFSESTKLQFPTHSVSCFQHLCLLSKIMTRIIDEFYVVGATIENAQSSLRSIDDLLRQWEDNLPEGLRLGRFNRSMPEFRHAPNVLCLHVIYNTLIILLHRPLVADGHLRSASPPAVSWKRCSEAAERISHIVSSYRQLYTLRGAPYLVSYGLYVACTIHVRNAGLSSNEAGSEHHLILEHNVRWLEELAVPNPAVSRTASIIRELMSTCGVQLDRDSGSRSLNLQEEPADTTQTSGEQGISYFAKESSSLWEAPDSLFSNWRESFSGDALYGFMDEQSSFGGLM